MASIPKNGTYAPINKTMSIQITNVDTTTGVIEGIYTHLYTPEGKIEVNGNIGGYAFVKNNDGGSGTAPFSINFTVSELPDGAPYCIVDFWNGFYTIVTSEADNTPGDVLVMSGIRSYVKSNGVTQSTVLGTYEFQYTPPSSPS